MTEYRSLNYMNDGNETEISRWIRWSRWKKLDSNVIDDQSLDDSVVNPEWDCCQTPSVIKCGISFVDVSHGLDHA